MTILKLLVASIFILIPFGELLRIDLGNDIFFKPLDGLAVLLSLLFVALVFLKRVKFPKSFLSKPLIIFLSLALISLLINYLSLSNNQFITAFLYWVRFAAYVGVYFIILSFGKVFAKKLQSALFTSGIMVLIIGYIQYFFYPNLRNLYYLGWDEHNYRLFSSFLDPNFAGSFLVLFLLLTFGLIRDKMQVGNMRSTALLSTVAVATFFSIQLTYSRSALLMLLAGLTTYLLLIGKKKYIFISIVIFCAGLIVLLPTFNKENTNLLRITSSVARFETYKNAITIINNKPVFGVGFNAYRYAQQSYGFRKTNTQFESHADAGVDSSILFVTATTGIVGLVAYIFLWYKIIERAIIQKRKGGIYSNVVISSVAGLFVSSLFINSLFFPTFVLWIWIIIALMEKE
jgi:hypothetical protein